MDKTPFIAPNFTQTPNNWFAMIPDMDNQEMRCTAILIRETFGYHRKEARLSLTKLMEKTGLSKQGVINGTNAGIDRGTISKIQDGGVNKWVVNVVDQDGNPLVNEVDPPTGRGSLPGGHPSIKQNELNKGEEGIETEEEKTELYIHLEEQKLLDLDLIENFDNWRFQFVNPDMRSIGNYNKYIKTVIPEAWIDNKLIIWAETTTHCDWVENRLFTAAALRSLSAFFVVADPEIVYYVLNS